MKPEEPGSSGRFTPAQQTVAAALMVVLKRASKDGGEALLTTKQTLVSNNIATHAFVTMLPDEGRSPH